MARQIARDPTHAFAKDAPVPNTDGPRRRAKVDNQSSMLITASQLEDIRHTQTAASKPCKLAYSVREAASELSVSLAQIYVLLGLGKLRGKKAGGRTLILGEEIDRYLKSLPDVVINLPPSVKRREEARASEAPLRKGRGEAPVTETTTAPPQRKRGRDGAQEAAQVPPSEAAGSGRTTNKPSGKAGRRHVEATAGAEAR